MIIVLGAFRSGTSLVSALLAELGVDFGASPSHFPPADRFNPLGYFQLSRVVSANKKLLRSASVDLADPPSPGDIAARADLAILKDIGLGDGPRPHGLKDPRFSLTLECWCRAGRIDPGELRIVTVARDVEAVAKSVLGHHDVRRYCGGELERARAMTRALQAAAAWHARERAAESLAVAYEDILADPARQVARLAHFVGKEDRGQQRRALSLIGKDAALRRHYLRYVTNPHWVAIAAAKTVRAKFAR